MADKNTPIHEIRLGAIRVSVGTNVNRDGSRWQPITLGQLYAGAITTAHDWIEQRSIRPEADSFVKELVPQARDRGKNLSGRSL